MDPHARSPQRLTALAPRCPRAPLRWFLSLGNSCWSSGDYGAGQSVSRLANCHCELTLRAVAKPVAKSFASVAGPGTPLALSR